MAAAEDKVYAPCHIHHSGVFAYGGPDALHKIQLGRKGRSVQIVLCRLDADFTPGITIGIFYVSFHLCPGRWPQTLADTDWLDIAVDSGNVDRRLGPKRSNREFDYAQTRWRRI